MKNLYIPNLTQGSSWTTSKEDIILAVAEYILEFENPAEITTVEGKLLYRIIVEKLDV